MGAESNSLAPHICLSKEPNHFGVANLLLTGYGFPSIGQQTAIHLISSSFKDSPKQYLQLN